MKTYTLRISGDDEHGYTAETHGVYQAKPHDVLEWAADHIVLREHGYTMNPGSRCSGLTSSCPTEIVVYRIVERKGKSLRVEHAVSWRSRGNQVRDPAERAEGGAS